jgi:hypothetical protein
MWENFSDEVIFVIFHILLVTLLYITNNIPYTREEDTRYLKNLLGNLWGWLCGRQKKTSQRKKKRKNIEDDTNLHTTSRQERTIVIRQRELLETLSNTWIKIYLIEGAWVVWLMHLTCVKIQGFNGVTRYIYFMTMEELVVRVEAGDKGNWQKGTSASNRLLALPQGIS